MYKDDRFLDLRSNELRMQIARLTIDESWESTARAISEKGMPCQCIFRNHLLQGILFENKADKLAFLLRLENVLQR